MSPNLPQPDRRSMLRGMGAIAAAGGLAACSSKSVDSATSSVKDAASSVSSAGSSAASSLAADGASIPKSKVAVGAGYIDTAKQVVVSQPTAGDYKAFSTICTHQGCPMVSLSGTTISCNCHGSQFSVTDGSVKQGPATQPLNAKKVTQQGDNLVVS